MPAVQSRFVVRMFSTFVLFSVLAGQFWRSLGGWWGFGLIAALVVAGSITLLVTQKSALNWRRFPKTLVAFMALATLSIAWSFYPAAAALGVTLQWITTLAAVFLALTLTWAELLRTLAAALRWVLGLSILFELFVAAVIRGPILPFFVDYSDYGDEKIPQAFYWSRALLFDGGPIEGIVASRNLLGFVALLAVIVFGVQLAAKTVKRGWAVAWLVFAIGMLVLTRSATVTLSTAFVVVVLAFALWTRHAHPQHRRPIYATAAAAIVLAGTGLLVFSSQLLGLLGKSEDLTGRFDIWNSVTDLASERPIFGWGWVSYWNPFVEPFAGLAERKGVVYLQAHNAWLDVWLQLGIVGVVILALLALSTLWRAWFLAVDRPRLGIADTTPYAASALLPLLLLAALLAQSMAESRLLVEYGWVLLIVLAVMTKRHQGSPSRMP
ncbi:O-antigen ligase family protein [Cryobacterium melibiosiphilum]|uniref:O-antigen ligase family protein n=1 Tax=Cryobacterium melibiosiphilum TaxID=995039 RepID=A0A3A5MCG7_9MICO|nr:O-antigen ligase family protein [Cryobacterium melibiosiphilum]RJT87817.1 O-antigen ligase family protein [Cryobacterium melibiosiphilum]